MVKITVPSLVLHVICYALELFINISPGDSTCEAWRAKKVNQYVQDFVQLHPLFMESQPCKEIECLEKGESRKTETFRPGNLGQMKLLIPKLHSQGYPQELPRSIILMPCRIKCCGEEMSFTSSGSKVTVYLTSGIQKGEALHMTCSVCKTQYRHSYAEMHGDANRKQYFYSEFVGTSDFFEMSRSTVFSKKYLREISVDIALGRTFEDLTARYNRLYGNCEEVRGEAHKQRLEDAYFQYQLLMQHKKDLTVHIDNVSCRPHFDELCDELVENHFLGENTWKHHACAVSGCKEGFVMCDGNEKLRRRICAAPKHTLRFAKNMPNIVDKCGNNPIFGGKSKTASRYCTLHSDLDTTDPPAKKIIMTISLPDQQVTTRIADMTQGLPPNSETSMHTACKRMENVKRYHDTTAGVMAIVRPCGIVLDWRELYTCESSSQLFVQLLKLMDEDGTNIRYVGYDRACEFVPFLRNLRAKGNIGAEKLLEAEYLVDNFHITGHSTPACNIEDERCEFHHKLPKFEAIKDANTGCAEQAFSWLKKYKNMVKYMTAPRFRFILLTVINAHNSAIDSKTSIVPA